MAAGFPRSVTARRRDTADNDNDDDDDDGADVVDDDDPAAPEILQPDDTRRGGCGGRGGLLLHTGALLPELKQPSPTLTSYIPEKTPTTTKKINLTSFFLSFRLGTLGCISDHALDIALSSIRILLY